MFTELQRTVREAILAGTGLREIEDQIINRAPLDEEQRSALWLYAEAWSGRPARKIPSVAEPGDGER